MKIKLWVGVLVFIILSAVIFYTCYVLEQKSLIVSLFGLFFVLFLGLLTLMLDYWAKRKNLGLLKWTIMVLVLVNFTFFIMEFVLFSGNLSDFLIYSITYTVVYCGIVFIRYHRGLESNP